MLAIQTTYEIKIAHSKLEGKPLKTSETLLTVVKWLKNKECPYNYDVNIYNWDGYDYELHTETGDSLIEMWDRGNKKPVTEK